MEKENEIMSASKAAQYLCMTRGLLYKLTSQHRVPYYKPCGKKVFFRKADLDQWLDKGRVATDAELQQKGGFQ